jgi:hypothetical protein
MIDRILTGLEILLLIRIVWQGELIVHFEREVYRIQSEREKERKEWREAKRRQAIKKSEIITQIKEGINV